MRRRLSGLRRAHEELLWQLRLAEQVQRSMLPRVLPCTGGLELAASLRPTQHMAGDFYNVFRLDRENVGVYLGDVVGHGPAAALLSVFMMQSIVPKRIEGHRYELLPPNEVLESLNRALIRAEFPGGPFVTMIYGILNPRAGTWSYCCAGHPRPLRLRPGRDPEELPAGSPLLGVFEGPFEAHTVRLDPGDRLLLHTDGAAAACWPDGSRGVAGLARWVAPGPDAPPLQEHLDRAVASARFPDDPADDIAALVASIAAAP